MKLSQTLPFLRRLKAYAGKRVITVLWSLTECPVGSTMALLTGELGSLMSSVRAVRGPRAAPPWRSG